MTLAIKRYPDKTFIPLLKPWTRRIEYGRTNEGLSGYPANAKKSIKTGLKNGSVHFEATSEGGEYISGKPKKKPGIIRRYVSKMLDNAAAGIISGTGSKSPY